MSPIALPTPIPPDLLRQIVETYGYKVIAESQYNWLLVRDGSDEPLILPRIGELVSVEVMVAMFTHTGMDLRTYFALKKLATGEASNPVQ